MAMARIVRPAETDEQLRPCILEACLRAIADGVALGGANLRDRGARGTAEQIRRIRESLEAAGEVAIPASLRPKRYAPKSARAEDAVAEARGEGPAAGDSPVACELAEGKSAMRRLGIWKFERPAAKA